MSRKPRGVLEAIMTFPATAESAAILGQPAPKSEPKHRTRGQVMITLSPEELADLDSLAEEDSRSRAAMVGRLAVNERKRRDTAARRRAK